MADEPSYLLEPIYGNEPWKPVAGKSFADSAGLVPASPSDAQFGGGAEITAQNLLVNLWSITESDEDTGLPIQGAQLIPAPNFGVPEVFPGITNFGSVGLSQLLDSRSAARFLLSPLTEEGPEPPLLGVMNPPGGMKTLLQNALKGFILDPSGIFGISGGFNSGALDGNVWGFQASQPSGFDGGDPVPFEVVFGSLAGSFFSDIPFLKTSGADGSYPEFFTPLFFANPSEVQELLDAIATGNFYVPFIFDWDTETAPFLQLTVSWPHSAARGL